MKQKAMKKARHEDVPLASVLKFATKAYADGKLNVGLISEEKFNLITSREITRALKDIAHGKNLSPGFDNARDAAAYLKSR